MKTRLFIVPLPIAMALLFSSCADRPGPAPTTTQTAKAPEAATAGKKPALSEAEVRAELREIFETHGKEPTTAQEYVRRGQAYLLNSKYREAIADYTRALELDPQNNTAFSQRATAKSDLHDEKRAIEDYDQSLRLCPKDTGTMTNRGNSKRHLGDFDGALSDYRQAIAIYPTNSFAYRGIGAVNEERGDFDGARIAYLKAIEVEPVLAEYVRFNLVVVLRRLKMDESAANLQGALAKWGPGWMRSLGLYLTNQLSEKELLADAKQGRGKAMWVHLCEAYYYIGMTHLLKNDVEFARKCFVNSLSTQLTTVSEYGRAKAELKRLDDSSADSAKP